MISTLHDNENMNFSLLSSELLLDYHPLYHSLLACWPWLNITAQQMQKEQCVNNCVCVFSHSGSWKDTLHPVILIILCAYQLLCVDTCVCELLYICRYWDDQCCSYWTVRPDLSLLYLQTAPAPGLDQIRGCRLEVSWAEQRNEKRWNRCLPHKREREERRVDGWR